MWSTQNRLTQTDQLGISHGWSSLKTADSNLHSTCLYTGMVTSLFEMGEKVNRVFVCTMYWYFTSDIAVVYPSLEIQTIIADVFWVTIYWYCMDICVILFIFKQDFQQCVCFLCFGSTCVSNNPIEWFCSRGGSDADQISLSITNYSLLSWGFYA